MYRGHQHVLLDEVQRFVVDDRRGAIGSHAAGVRSCVAIVGALVILCGRQGHDRAAVGNRQDTCLLAVEPFLDHDLIAGVAELLVAADALDGLDRLGPGGADENAFARGQPGGFDHDRHVLAILQVRGGVIRVAKDLVVSGRHIGVPEQVLAIDLAALQLGGRGAGTEDAQPGVLERVDDAFDQRQLGANDGELHLVLLGELDQPREIGR